MTFEPIEHKPDDYELDDELAPHQQRGMSFGRRFWRSLTGQRTGAETRRPVAVLGDNGEPVHAMVRGAEPMTEEDQAVFGEIVRAAQRKHREELRAARQAADDDVRAVVRAIQEICAATNCYPKAVEDAIGALNWHFASRIAELNARDAKMRVDQDAEIGTAVHGLLADLGQRARDAKAAE